MPPAIAERHTVDLQPVGPDRAERLEQQLQDQRSGEATILLGAGDQDVVEAAGTRAGKQIRPCQHLLAKPAQQAGAPFQAEQGIVLAD